SDATALACAAVYVKVRQRQPWRAPSFFFFFFNDAATTEIYPLSLHDALPICHRSAAQRARCLRHGRHRRFVGRSEEHTSELQSRGHLVCRLLLEKKKARA